MMVLGRAGVPQGGLEVGRGAARRLLMGGSKPGVDLGCLRVRRRRSDTLPKHQFGGGYEETMKGRSSKVTHLFHPLKGAGGYMERERETEREMFCDPPNA